MIEPTAIAIGTVRAQLPAKIAGNFVSMRACFLLLPFAFSMANIVIAFLYVPGARSEHCGYIPRKPSHEQ